MALIAIDVGARVVQRDGKLVHLSPKAFDLLLMLVAAQPNAVARDRLQTALWPGIHVSETSLPVLVTQLRKALGGDAVRNVHSIGYAFAGTALVSGDAAASTAAPALRLVWKRKTFDLPQGVSIVGRDRGCTIRMDADSVSRQHARLRVSGAALTIEDLDSKNGTWVAGERIAAAVPLADGARVQIGSEWVRVEVALDERSTRTALDQRGKD
jgi:DNA-binding winged helix-turn-helix (wHTH) protein